MALLAHQGGWDEILVFAVPIVLYAVIRYWDERRGGAEDGATGDETIADADATDEPPSTV